MGRTCSKFCGLVLTAVVASGLIGGDRCARPRALLAAAPPNAEERSPEPRPTVSPFEPIGTGPERTSSAGDHLRKAVRDLVVAEQYTRAGVLLRESLSAEDPQAVETALSLLNDPLPNVRRTAALCMQGCAQDRFVLPLIEAMKDSDDDVRCGAIWYFKNHPDARAVEPLLAAATDRSEHVRRFAVEALGEHKDRRATGVLLKAAQNTTEELITRCGAGAALGKIGDPSVLPFLRTTALAAAENKWFRIGAVRGLGFTKDAGQFSLLLDLMTNLNEDGRVRAAAAEALGELGDPQALPALLAAAKTSKDGLYLPVFAAMSAIKLTHGAIRDAEILKVFKGEEPSFDGVEEYTKEKNEALAKVAQFGRTRAARRAAYSILQQRGGTGTLASDPPVEFFCVLYYLVGLLAWMAIYGKSLPRRQLSLRALFVLTAIIAAGLPLLKSALEL